MTLRLAEAVKPPSAAPTVVAVEPGAPARQRSRGEVAVLVHRVGGATRLARLAESGPSRLRIAGQTTGALEAVLVNTGGGIACGDRFSVAAEAGTGSALTLTTVAAEKAYRSDGAVAEIDVRLSLGAGARLDWLPQETIVFDRARLRRRIDVDVAADARLTVFEAVVFGREASGEAIGEGLFEDRWRIRREGQLIFADSLRLDGPVADLLARPSVAGGGRALATFLYVAPDAESRLEEARRILRGCAGECGAGAWNGFLAARFLAPSSRALRRDASTFLEFFRAAPLPRVWQS